MPVGYMRVSSDSDQTIDRAMRSSRPVLVHGTLRTWRLVTRVLALPLVGANRHGVMISRFGPSALVRRSRFATVPGARQHPC